MSLQEFQPGDRVEKCNSGTFALVQDGALGTVDRVSGATVYVVWDALADHGPYGTASLRLKQVDDAPPSGHAAQLAALFGC